MCVRVWEVCGSGHCKGGASVLQLKGGVGMQGKRWREWGVRSARARKGSATREGHARFRIATAGSGNAKPQSDGNQNWHPAVRRCGRVWHGKVCPVLRNG